MKNKHLANTAHWIKDAFLKALAVFLMVVAGYYAYGAISWPVQPNEVSGVVGTFVGESQGAFDSVMDYEDANAECVLAFPDSHVCTPDEMANSYNHGTPLVSPIFTYSPGTPSPLWINNGPPGFALDSNDCKGWQEITRGTPNLPVYGTVWKFGNKNAGALTPCDTRGLKFACCQ